MLLDASSRVHALFRDGNGALRPVNIVLGLALVFVFLFLLTSSSSPLPSWGSASSASPSPHSSSVRGGDADAGGGGGGSSTGGAYEQPPSKKRVWFDVAAAGGFREVALRQGALEKREGDARQWVVVTTINEPTPTIKRLARLADWRVVVVGDTKTPAGWSYPNVTYLSIADQRALGFSTTELLCTRCYTRKNVGYLYAVLHGARVVYETDDDNELTSADVTILAPGAAGKVLEFVSDALTINHHAHFGQPSTWPRGLPLEAIAGPHVTAVRRSPAVVPAVQQGLANGDPDMDAIFRLTRKPRDVTIDFDFLPGAAPVALPFGSFAPYNAQNTVFLYDALWALVLPQTVEFRVCDIWRAYFSQRLLWGIGAQLTFVTPYVHQLRNSHSYYHDYLSEAQIYDQVTAFLTWLRAWRCAGASGKGDGAASALPACAVALARDMATAGYWGPADAELVRHFFHDLARAGYVFPRWTELDAAEEKEGGGAAARYVRPCAAKPLPGPDGKLGAKPAACAAPGATNNEDIKYLPSIELVGTCGIAPPKA